MTGRIYLLNDGADLVAMEEAPYDSENLLQELLANHPDLLAGDQIDADEPRRWLLVSREMSVPDEQDGAGRWSLDHLFLDQDAIPTLVEVKRSSDTRIRREVMGQMLDYAANAVAYWPVEEIKAKVEVALGSGVELDEVVSALLDNDEADTDEYWQRVKTNLQAGRIRLVFVADHIPTELIRIIEFLNEQMDPAEVIAVEVKQFVGDGVKTLVPRVLGLTEAAKQKKRVGPQEKRKWDEQSFLAELAELKGDIAVESAKRLLEWSTKNGLCLWWGEGKTMGSFFPIFDNENGSNHLFAVWTTGYIELQFQHMNNPPFDDISKKQELLEGLNQIDGVDLSPETLTKRPSIDLDQVKSGQKMQQFLQQFDWVLSQLTPVKSYK